MKLYIETDDTSQATGAYLSFNSRTRQGHIPVKEVEIPTEEEIIEEAGEYDIRVNKYDNVSNDFIAGVEWLLSKLK